MYIQLILFSSFCEQIPRSCMRVSFSKNAYLLYSCSEISKAQDRLTDLLQNSYKTHPQYRELLRMIMSTVGRGGEGDVGQRIRDEILVLQVDIELLFFFFFFAFFISFCMLYFIFLCMWMNIGIVYCHLFIPAKQWLQGCNDGGMASEAT